MHVLARLAPRIGTGAQVALGVAMAVAVTSVALLHARVDRDWLFGLGIGVVICAAALLSGRNPGLAAVAGLAVFGVSGLMVALGVISPVGPFYGGGLAGLPVLGAVAVRRLAPRPAVIIGLAGTAVIAISETAGPTGLFDHRALYALTGTIIWFCGLAAGVYLRYLDFLQRQRLEEARLEERVELARELHDVVAHHVTGIVVQAQAARFAGRPDLQPLIGALGSIETAGLDTLTAIRRLVGLLRDPADAAGVSPGPEPIGELVERFTRHGPPVTLRLPADLPAGDWHPELASTMYRIVQEALTNIARHAPRARSVAVTITHDPRQVIVEITDDSPAVSQRPRPPGGYGLVGMRERVEALGGQLEAGPRPGAGWAVQASLPVPAAGQP
jgi:signal transduction histidine kinase